MFFAPAVFAAGGASAQKYPERRMARDGAKAYAGGDFEAAETAYRHALEAQPEFREATFNLGTTLMRQEKTEEAVKMWTAVAADSLADAGIVSAANFNLGNVMLAEEKIDEAIDFYKQALRLDPSDTQAKYNLAYARKLKEQQQNEEQNQDQEQQQDRNGGGDQNDEQSNDPNEDQGDNGENGDKDQNENNNEKPELREGENSPAEAKIDPGTASQMLDAVQAAEDDTREKVNAREEQVAPRSGKNW